MWSIAASAALTLILTKKFGAASMDVKLLAVWGMVVAWFMVHWRFARIYEYRSHRYRQLMGKDAFCFPETPVRSFADYTYFSFTIGSSFATSDVEVRGGDAAPLGDGAQHPELLCQRSGHRAGVQHDRGELTLDIAA